MKALQDYNLNELKEKVYDLINIVNIELRHKTSGKDMAVLANSFAKDLQIENSFCRLYLHDIAEAFRNGVREAPDPNKIFINIPTFYSWVRKQKDKINNDIYKVRTLNVPKEQAPLYREMPKLLTTKKQIK